MRPGIPTVAVDLETGERKYFPSTRRAAEKCGVGPEIARMCVIDDRSFHKWYFCATDELEAKAERIRYLIAKWRREGMPFEASCKPKAKLVSLRIDSHTVIMVPPEKATPEYAEQYREKMKNQSNKLLKSTNF